MRVLIDTNVALDVLRDRAGFVEASSSIWRLCEVGALTGYFSALSVANIIYILRKEIDPDSILRIVQELLLIFSVMDLTASDLREASIMKSRDFEDALQSVCASRVKAEYIITRNVRDFRDSPIPAITPVEMLEKIDL